jgi:hypothetical protein
MKARTVRLIVALLATGIVGVDPAFALNESTHEIINEQAARQSSLDQVLRSHLGFGQGIDEPVGGRAVFRWLRIGGVLEDDGARFFNHFHDPLYQADGSGRGPWAEAGLPASESSIRWMQRVNDPWSWQAVRRLYAAALKESDKGEREQAFANLFRGLGQVMHLVVDASVPEHVRNDIHPLGIIYDNYEYWVERQHGKPGSPEEQNFINTFLNPIGFDAAILQQPTNDSHAPVPIARLIDTDIYLGTDPNVTTGTGIGIAEVANANFFSEDTGDRTYPFPNLDRLIPTTHTPPARSTARAYFRKPDGEGLPADPVLAECVFVEPAGIEGIIIEPGVRNCTDPLVWSVVAGHMLPRAVDYTRGVLDYFFRGTLNFTVSPSTTTAGQSVLKIMNTSAETMDGKFTLYVDNLSDTRSDAASIDPLTLEPGARSPDLAFPTPSEVKVYVVVFEGKLGNPDPGSAVEEEAVVGKVQLVPQLYAISNVDNQLRVLNPATGATLLRVPISLTGETVTGGTGLATHPSTQELWAILKLAGQPGRQLAVIDPATGLARSIGDTGDAFAAIAFDTAGTLYGVTGDGAASPETLFTLSTINAARTALRTLGRGGPGEALAFNPDDGLLYHASGNASALDDGIFETIDPRSLTTTDIPLSCTPCGEMIGLTYQGSGLFLLTSQDSTLFTLTTSGMSSGVFDLESQIKGLAFR